MYCRSVIQEYGIHLHVPGYQNQFRYDRIRFLQSQIRPRYLNCQDNINDLMFTVNTTLAAARLLLPNPYANAYLTNFCSLPNLLLHSEL